MSCRKLTINQSHKILGLYDNKFHQIITSQALYQLPTARASGSAEIRITVARTTTSPKGIAATSPEPAARGDIKRTNLSKLCLGVHYIPRSYRQALSK